MELTDIIKNIKSLGLTGYQISQETDLTQVGVDKIINGTSKKPQKKTLDILTNYLNKKLNNSSASDNNNSYAGPNTDDLKVNDTFEYEYLENNHSNSFLKLETGQYIMTMPLADFDVQAGFVDGYQDPEFLNGLKKHTMFVEKPVRGKYVAFKVRGDSMDNGKSDAIVKDSIVSTRELQRHLWRDQIRFKDFEYWVIYTTASRLPLLKQITGHDVEKGIITCHSLNDGPEYQDFELPLDEVQALFYVVDVHRKIVKRTEY